MWKSRDCVLSEVAGIKKIGQTGRLRPAALPDPLENA
jgi:hypothetical protein